jgi:hypothetical protein
LEIIDTLEAEWDNVGDEDELSLLLRLLFFLDDADDEVAEADLELL